MILVTGATGQVGGMVLKDLISQGVKPLRAMIRDEMDRASVPPGIQAVVADFADSASLDRALAGIQSAYLVCAAIPQLVELETNFLKACRRAGASHVVLHSALGAADFNKSFPAWHRQVEDQARALKIPCTILRPNGFMQNVKSFFAPTIKTQDCFFDALGSAKISHIDVRDIATAAARALTTKTTIDNVYELSGPKALGGEELASKISKVAGRPIRYVPLTLDQMLQGMISSGMPAPVARPVVELYEYYRTGKGEASDDALRTLISRAPRTIDAYLAENAQMFAK